MRVTGIENAEKVSVAQPADIRECLIEPGIPTAGDHARRLTLAGLRGAKDEQTQQSTSDGHARQPARNRSMTGQDDE